MVVLVVAAAVAMWLGLAAGLAAFMARRRYDHTAWLVVCLLFGPVGVVFVVMELSCAIPREATVIDRGHVGRGDLDVLIVAGSNLDAARATLARFDDRLRRVAVNRVVPLDGPREVERLAAEQLRADARTLRRPDAELLLLFGVPSDAVARYVSDSHFDIVVGDDVDGGRCRSSDQAGRRLVGGPARPRGSGS